MIKKTRKYTVAIVMAGLFAGGFAFGYQWKATLAAAAAAEAEAAWQKERAALAKSETAASEAARKEEQQIGAGLNAAAADYLKEKDNAKDQESRLIAELNADVVRLRKLWRGCETHRLSEASRSAAELDAEAGLRAASAAAVVRAAAECDAHVSGLQRALSAERHPDGRD